eukprot:TRINITY_DN12734_c0_g1_i3.p1 TRINITY_DN12734_c0_g1~~TRINITY_DN12734_c0_g1_i3.p1  ORF type:complete len:120 (-),score=10.85 TRINITY_DN12734_c0_g1_i3:80-439(-)
MASRLEVTTNNGVATSGWDEQSKTSKQSPKSPRRRITKIQQDPRATKRMMTLIGGDKIKEIKEKNARKSTSSKTQKLPKKLEGRHTATEVAILTQRIRVYNSTAAFFAIFGLLICHVEV